MQITVDVKQLTPEERDHIAGFILTYPQPGVNKIPRTPPIKNGDTVVINGVEHIIGGIDDEMAILQHDHDSTLPNVAFGTPAVDEAAAAFGNVVPLVPPATLAHSTVVAGQSQTAPVEETQATENTGSAVTTDFTGGAQTDATHTNRAGNVEVDKNGLPWDHRIHSESRTQIADGTWRKKRGCDPALVAAVESELRQVMGAAPAVTTPPPPPPAATTHVPPPPPATTTQAPPAPAGDVDAIKSQYVALVGRVSAAISSKRVALEEVTAVCASYGVPALPLLINRLDLVPTVANAIDAIIQSPQV